MPPTTLTPRRYFLESALLGTAAFASLKAFGLTDPGEFGTLLSRSFPIGGFSKPFQQLSPEETTQFIVDVGWDGIECPVRARGQVEPARVDEELPRLVEALGKKQKRILQAATDILRLDQPHAERTLRALAQQGVKHLRLGFFRYRGDRSPQAELAALRPALKDLAAACAELGLWAGIQNHSGSDWIGASLWDIAGLVEEIGNPALGICFDIGHATVEGGLSWPTDFRRAQPHVGCVMVKDFLWEKKDGKWIEGWCHLGEGMVDREFFRQMRRSAFQGPIIQHHEYELKDLASMKAAMRADLVALQDLLAWSALTTKT